MQRTAQQPYRQGRLQARPTAPTEIGPPGLHRLGLGEDRDGLIYVPASVAPDQPAPLCVVLHGAGGQADHAIGMLRHMADETGCILLAPDSRYRTWDIIALDHYGPDVAFCDRALMQAFSHYRIDPQRLALSGFSDGASYALSVGIANGDLYTHIIAFSPGYAAPVIQVEAPKIFVSHGTDDEVLPIASCSHRLVPLLRNSEYDVTYYEFEGGHTVPPEVIFQAQRWFLES